MIPSLKQAWHNAAWRDELSSPVVQWVGLAIALLILWWAVISPYQTWRSQLEQQVAQQQLQWQKLDQLSQRRDTLQKGYATVNQHYQTVQNALMDERTNSRAISAQVRQLESLFRPLGIKFTGRRFAEPSMTPWLGENVQSNWRFEGTSDDLLIFLYRLANQTTVLEPIQIDIKAGNARRGKTPDYEMAINVRGYRQLPLQQLSVRSTQ